jgi:hypothetical protein
MILLRPREKWDRCQFRVERRIGILLICPWFVFATDFYAVVWS